jgi:D-lactate dehydrogenase
MKTAVFNTKPYDKRYLQAANQQVETPHLLSFLQPRLTREVVRLAAGFEAVCVFVNDELDRAVLEALSAGGTRLIALRCSGFNNVDLQAATALGVTVARVPAYSPHAVAEHTLAMILSLNRRIHRAYNRVREGNFALDGFVGFDLHGQTMGVVGTGQIGRNVVRILRGFGCEVLVYDIFEHPDCAAMGATYVSLEELFAKSRVVTLHCPLTPETHHLIDADALSHMQDGVMIVNTSRGALIDTKAVIKGLKTGRVGALALDVYEEEADLFFENLSEQVIQDDVFTRLLTFPNVLITGHQGFFTENALRNIAATTIDNLTAFETDKGTLHRVEK